MTIGDFEPTFKRPPGNVLVYQSKSLEYFWANSLLAIRKTRASLLATKKIELPFWTSVLFCISFWPILLVL
jgi:hypothetical protein